MDVREVPQQQSGWLSWIKALLSYPNGLALAVVIGAGYRWISLPTDGKQQTEMIALAIVVVGAMTTSVLNQWVCDCRQPAPPVIEAPVAPLPPPAQQPTTVVVQAPAVPAPVVVHPTPAAPLGNGSTPQQTTA